MMLTSQQLIKKYSLLPHPEGGWYKETYKSNEYISQTSLPDRFDGTRSFSTAIYFLLEQGNFSAFHRIKSDELWHYYMGDPLILCIIRENGELNIVHLGNDIEKGQLFQYVVPANCWFATILSPASLFCFVGCTVAPGFEFEDLEMAIAEELISLYPQHKEIISQLCK